jgi:hypothetical protein
MSIPSGINGSPLIELWRVPVFKYYGAAVQLIKELGGRPHLGKYCNGFDVDYLQKLHGEYLQTFQHVMVQHDPPGKFSNAFTERLFGPNAHLADPSFRGSSPK